MENGRHYELPADTRLARENAIERLVGNGAGLVLCGGESGKDSIRSQGKAGEPVKPSAREVKDHLNRKPYGKQIHNVGVLLETIGAAVVDFDGAPHIEHEQWASVISHGALPLIVLRTGSGGRHVYYRCESGAYSPSSVDWQLPRFDGKHGMPTSKEKSDRAVSGELLFPWGRYTVLYGDAVVKLAAALYDGKPDAGLIHPEILDLFRPPMDGNLPQLLHDVRHAPEGSRNDTFNKAVYGAVYTATTLTPGGVAEHAFRAVGRATGMTEGEVEATLTSARAGKVKSLPTRANPLDPVEDGKRAVVKPLGDDKQLVPEGFTREGIKRGLKALGVKLARVKEYADTPYVAIDCKDYGAQLTEDSLQPLTSSLRKDLQGDFRTSFVYPKLDGRTGKTINVPMATQDGVWEELFRVVSKEIRIDTIGDFLGECDEFTNPDEAYRVLQDEFADRVWRINPAYRDIARFAFPAMLIAGVGRHYHPGAKFDQMIVLMGQPGKGKSSFVKHALPDEPRFKKRFAEGIKFQGAKHIGDKAICEAIRGCMFAEIEELSAEGLDCDHLKGFISRTSDTYRVPFERISTMQARTAVLVATTNKSAPLPSDPTGHRKFLIVKIDDMADGCVKGEEANFMKAFWDANRKRLFGAAKCCWEAGLQGGSSGMNSYLAVPTNLYEVIAEKANFGSDTDSVVESLTDALAAIPDEFDYLTAEELAEAVGRRRKDGEGNFTPLGGRLYRDIKQAFDSMQGVWEGVSRRVRTKDPSGEYRAGKLRVYVRVGAEVLDGMLHDEDARRATLSEICLGNGRASGGDNAFNGKRLAAYSGGAEDADDIPF